MRICTADIARSDPMSAGQTDRTSVLEGLGKPTHCRPNAIGCVSVSQYWILIATESEVEGLADGVVVVIWSGLERARVYRHTHTLKGLSVAGTWDGTISPPAAPSHPPPTASHSWLHIIFVLFAHTDTFSSIATTSAGCAAG